MGEVRVPQCDIFKTLQPKGLRYIHVEVTDTEVDDGTTDSGKAELFICDLAVSKRGRARVLRMVEHACQPPKTREPKADAEQPNP